MLDVVDLLSAERDENAVRKDFTPTEAVAIGRLIEEKHREKIAARDSTPEGRRVYAAKKGTSTLKDGEVEQSVQSGRARQGTLTDKLIQPAGATREVASKAVGMSWQKYGKAKEVVAAAERDENAVRKDFTPTEAVAIGRLIEERERPAALERKKRKPTKIVADESTPTSPLGRVTEIAAIALGIGEQKYKQAKAVVAAAERDRPPPDGRARRLFSRASGALSPCPHPCLPRVPTEKGDNFSFPLQWVALDFRPVPAVPTHFA